MKYERFIDKVRMVTCTNERPDPLVRNIHNRIYPRIRMAANSGDDRIVYAPSPNVFTSIDHWVGDNWFGIKTYLEEEGFECQAYPELGEYHIMW